MGPIGTNLQQTRAMSGDRAYRALLRRELDGNRRYALHRLAQRRTRFKAGGMAGLAMLLY
jgi:hypothetical protein